MSKFRFDRLLAATLLAAAAPAVAQAAPDRVRSVLPLPPSLNGEMIRHSDQVPEPPSAPAARVQEKPAEAVPARRPEHVQAQPADAHQQPATPHESGLGLRGTLDRLLSAGDDQIAGKLKETIARHAEKNVTRPADRKAIEAFYASRNYAPLWTHDGRLTDAAKTAIARLKNAAADGFDASD